MSSVSAPSPIECPLLSQEKIAFAGDVLVRNAVVKVVDDDVVLTYAFSSIILNILLKAQQVTRRRGVSA